MTGETVAVRRKAVKAAGPDGSERLPLSQGRVVAAASAMADVAGLEGLSMRSLARELGVEAMSLYHWFGSKKELLAAMLDEVYAEMEKPDPASPAGWKASLRSAAISAHHALLKHRWACSLLMDPGGISMARLDWMNAVLGTFRSAGLSPMMTHHAYHAYDSHIAGFTMWLLPLITAMERNPDLGDTLRQTVSLAGLPHLAEHVAVHDSPEDDGIKEFEFGLDMLLDGLQRTLTL